MPRTARQVVEGAPHHVVLRGNNRRRLFSYPRDYSFFIWLVGDGLRRYSIELNALCLMQNHVHLLLTPFRASAMAAFVKRVSQRYAQVRNKRYRTTGKLYEQRYYSKPIETESHLAVATAYIDLNPVRGFIVHDGAAYAWSTLRVHCGLHCSAGLDSLWSPTDWYEGLGRDPNQRAAAYRRWIEECRERDEWDIMRRDPSPPEGGTPTRPNRSRASS
jgi:putative transposase